jgi:photosynthetic reaction center cytochrome c subunit
VARRMIEMTRDININWKQHVADTGVTCYTCHRGKPVPDAVWFVEHETAPRGAAAGTAGQNRPAAIVNLTSLPYDPFTPYLLNDGIARVISKTALPTGNTADIKTTEQTYAMMIHTSQALGVNCTHCHNSRSFLDWPESNPQRVVAWYAIQMSRLLNQQYMVPLTDVFPASRLGPTGDVAKVNCTTCHMGQPKPLNGVSMLPNHPELARIKPPPVVPAADPGADPATAAGAGPSAADVAAAEAARDAAAASAMGTGGA